MKIVVIGATGFLGTKLNNILSKKHEVIGTYYKKKEKNLEYLDASNFEEVKKFLLSHKPNIIIDTIGLANFSICEKNPKLAEKINYLTAKNIAKISKLINAKIIFISSSYIFDGRKGDYNEEDIPTPSSEYGKTKLMAEKEFLKIKGSIILRVDFFYGYNGKNKNNGIIDEVFPKKEIYVRNPEQIKSPILIDDIAKIIEFLIKEEKSGIFNIASKEKMKKYDLLKILAETLNEKCKISINSIENPNLNIPHISTLNISKIENLGIKTHSLKDGIKIIREQIKNN